MSDPQELGRELGRAVAERRAELYRYARVMRWVDLAGLVVCLPLWLRGDRHRLFGLGVGWYVLWFAVSAVLNWVAWRKLDPRRAGRGTR